MEIFVKENNVGGELILNDANDYGKIPSPLKEKELVLAMFYHDVQQKITKNSQTEEKKIFRLKKKEN